MSTQPILHPLTGSHERDLEKVALEYSIIIPAYNEEAELPATLKALRFAMARQGVAGELIVVDNNSNDKTSEVAIAKGADHVVFEPINQIARARNAGASVAKGRYLVFVDADTRIEPVLLTKALQCLEDGYAGGGAVLEFEGEVNAIGRFGTGMWEMVSRAANLAAGSFIFCYADGFREIGGFDKALYAGEEIAFSRGLKKWGKPLGMPFKVINSPAVKTSARKLQWYSRAEILGWMLFILVFPIAIRWRKLCGFWYRRPEASRTLARS